MDDDDDDLPCLRMEGKGSCDTSGNCSPNGDDDDKEDDSNSSVVVVVVDAFDNTGVCLVT